MESKKLKDFENEAKQFKSILVQYKNTNKPFVDPNFLPTLKIHEREVDLDSSMDGWMRIDEIYDAPLFKKELISPDFVHQGELGDCYFLAALSRIAKQPYLVPPLFDINTPNQVLGRVKNSINIKCGAVVVYFNCFGRKTPVLIDTYVPIKYNQVQFSRPSDITKSAWFCLVEKAYAKLNGSYSDIIGGTLPQAIYSMYGYYPTNKDFEDLQKPEKLEKMSVFDRIMKYQKKGAVMGTAITLSKLTNGVTAEELGSKGLIAGHCYLLLKAREHDGKQFLCLRNPWGNHEWNGDWSDESPKWTPELKEGLGWKPGNDGTFWMCAKDYFRYFSTVEVSLPISPEWFARRFYVQITPGDHDGYNIESSNAKIAERPNFAFQVTDPIPEGEKCRFHILVEKRYKLYDEERSTIWSPPQFCVILAHSNGKKLSPVVLNCSNRFVMQSSLQLLSFSYEVNGNDDIITIAIHRLQSCNLIEDCYVLVYCERDFNLYDIDHPDKLIPEEYNAGIVFDNFSTRHPNVARPLKKKKVKDHDVITFGELTKSDLNPTKDELIARYKEEIDARRDEIEKKKDVIDVVSVSSDEEDSDNEKDKDPKVKTKNKAKSKEEEELIKAKEKEKEEAIRAKEKEKQEAIEAKEKEKKDAIEAKEREKEEALRQKEKEKADALNEKDREINEANEEIERLRALLKSAQRQKNEKENMIKQLEEKMKSQEEIEQLRLEIENEKKQIDLEKKKINSEKRRAKKLIDDDVNRKIKENEEKMKKQKKEKKTTKDKSSDDSDKPTKKPTSPKKTLKKESSDDSDEPKKKPAAPKKTLKKESSDDSDEPIKKPAAPKKTLKKESSDDSDEPVKKPEPKKEEKDKPSDGLDKGKKEPPIKDDSDIEKPKQKKKSKKLFIPRTTPVK